MGTRGAYGFRVNNIDKIAYNHYDSYPEGLGKDIINFIKTTKLTSLKSIAKKIILISEESVPTEAEIKLYTPFADLSVSTQKITDWYVLLRKAQGNLSIYRDMPEFVHMINNSNFLLDSLFCEYAYIIDVDKMTLEFYKGFNHKKIKGRYSSKTLETLEEVKNRREYIYYGVVLMHTIPLADIKTKYSTEEIIDIWNKKINK